MRKRDTHVRVPILRDPLHDTVAHFACASQLPRRSPECQRARHHTLRAVVLQQEVRCCVRRHGWYSGRVTGVRDHAFTFVQLATSKRLSLDDETAHHSVCSLLFEQDSHS